LDESVWGPIASSLKRRGVVIQTGVSVSRLVIRDGAACGVVISDGKTIEARGVIMCLPPKPMASILNATGLWSYESLAKATRYIPYYSYSVHVGAGVRGPLVQGSGFQDTPWGLIWMDLGFMGQTRVLSVAITRVDATTLGGLRARGSKDDVIVTEVLRQLPLTREAREHVLRVVPTRETDHAYVNRVGTPSLPFLHPHIKGLAMVSCANGQSAYPFTSIEAAIQNAMVFCGRRPRQPWTVWSATMTAVLVVAMLGGVIWFRKAM
jgi:hypothetical protein